MHDSCNHSCRTCLLNTLCRVVALLLLPDYWELLLKQSANRVCRWRCCRASAMLTRPMPTTHSGICHAWCTTMRISLLLLMPDSTMTCSEYIHLSLVRGMSSLLNLVAADLMNGICVPQHGKPTHNFCSLHSIVCACNLMRSLRTNVIAKKQHSVMRSSLKPALH